MKQEILEKVKKKVIEFFEKGGFQIEVEDLCFKENTIFVKIKTEEPKIIIGRNGSVLLEIQRLLGSILKKRLLEENVFLNMDVNNYREKKEEYLKELAEEVANEVALLGKEKALPPMPAYERRIIHLALAQRRNVMTESIGEGSERRVVIKPKIKNLED